MVRTFIAIELPEKIKHDLTELVANVKNSQIRSLRWVPLKNIHLTLKFIGNIENKMVPLITQEICKIVNKFKRFEIQIGGLGAFPVPQKPRVIWIGCRLPHNGYVLQKELEDCLVPLGIAKENRKFHPHLTLARVTKFAKGNEYHAISDMILNGEITKTWNMRVDQVKLFRSDLLPEGAQYRVIAEASLNHENR